MPSFFVPTQGNTSRDDPYLPGHFASKLLNRYITQFPKAAGMSVAAAPCSLVPPARNLIVMLKRLRHAPDEKLVLEVETANRRHLEFDLPSCMSPAARIAFLCSPRLMSILARLDEAGGDEAEGYVTFALQKLAMDLVSRHPGSEDRPTPPPALEQLPAVPVAHVVIHQCCPSTFVLCTSYKDVSICREEELDTLQDALAAALLDLPPEAVAVEVSYEGIVSGTYPRPLVERDPEFIAKDAVRTQEVILNTPPPAPGF